MGFETETRSLTRMPPRPRAAALLAMRQHPRPAALHILGLLALSLSPAAQRTWIVDPENRAGTDFTTLGGAIAASVDGDTIQVRPTALLLDISATTSKALTIVGAGANHTFDGRLT